MDTKPIYLEATIELQKETAALREKAETTIKLPKGSGKQPDLLYFTAIFVSSGENLNHAYFLPSELVAAENTIVNKALDIEHKESEIVGHIYDRAFMTKEGTPLDVQELASKETASLDKEEMHVTIAGIVYKNRFPNLADEVASGKWKVSMECYFANYDVKVGDLIITQNEAEVLGLAHTDASVFGRAAKVLKKGKEIASGTVTRVLRDILFSGCGVVQQPANPPSVILETANKKVKKGVSKEVIILDYDKLDAGNKVTSQDIEAAASSKETSEMVYDDTTGICVSYKKQVLDATFKGPDAKVLHENWCSLYESGCTSFSRDTTDPDCLKNKEAMSIARASVVKLKKKREALDRRGVLLEGLLSAIKKADKFRS